MKTLTFLPGNGTTQFAYFKATGAFRLHLEFNKNDRTTTTIGVRSTTSGRYDECWSTTGHTIDKRFAFDDDQQELYVMIRVTAIPTKAEVNNEVTISNVAQ